MEEKERILQENFREYFELAEHAFNSKKYNSAVTLFFKAICAQHHVCPFSDDHF